MPARLPRRADDKIEIAGECRLAGADKFNRGEHRRQAAFLFASAAPPHALTIEFEWRPVDDLSGIGILHRARRRAHGIAYEHQSIRALSAFDVQNQVSLFIDKGLQTRLLQLRLDDISDQRQYLRLALEQFGLRAWVSHQLDRQALDLVVRKILFD